MCSCTHKIKYAYIFAEKKNVTDLICTSDRCLHPIDDVVSSELLGSDAVNFFSPKHVIGRKLLTILSWYHLFYLSIFFLFSFWLNFSIKTNNK